MNPLSIAVGDYLLVSFFDNSKKTPLKITVVTPSTVNGQKSYAVTAGGVVYTCTAANTVAREQTAPDTSADTVAQVTVWVIGQ